MAMATRRSLSLIGSLVTGYGMAKGSAVKPLLAVLKGSGPATVKMGKAATTLPEKGRAEALAKFAKACRLD